MSITYTRPRKMDIQLPEEQHEIWADLYARQLVNIQKYACRDYLEGFDILGLSPTRIPSLKDLNAVIKPRTAWRTVRTHVRYSDALPWYHHFAKKQFLITNYMRGRNEMEFTPEPDMFHDIFGHLPFMVHPHYANLQEIFAPAFLRANEEQRENVKRLAWFSTEFGLIQENGETKIFGAGLISSIGEIAHALSGNVPVLPFTIDHVIGNQKAIYAFNEVLFVIESVSALKSELASYFDSF